MDFLRESNLINGEWIGSDSGDTIAVTNPATGDVIGVVPRSGRTETQRAITSSELSFDSFRRTSAVDRAGILRRMSDIMMKHQDSLAELLTLEMGKPLAEAKGEIGIGAQYLVWFAEEARRVYGDLVPSPWTEDTGR